MTYFIYRKMQAVDDCDSRLRELLEKNFFDKMMKSAIQLLQHLTSSWGPSEDRDF